MISEAVFLATSFALRGWLSVVHVVMRGLEGAQIGEYRLQVIVSHSVSGRGMPMPGLKLRASHHVRRTEPRRQSRVQPRRNH